MDRSKNQKYEIKEPNGIVLVMWRKEQKTVGHTTNRGRPRTRWKDGSVSFVEHWHRVARGPVEVSVEGLRRPTTDIQRLKH